MADPASNGGLERDVEQVMASPYFFKFFLLNCVLLK
jgi:hypothetical protein